MSNSIIGSGQDPLQPKNRSEQQILKQLRRELKRGVNIMSGGVCTADVIRLQLSDDPEIRRSVEELVRRAEKRFGSGPATQKQAKSAIDTAFDRHMGLDQ